MESTYERMVLANIGEENLRNRQINYETGVREYLEKTKGDIVWGFPRAKNPLFEGDGGVYSLVLENWEVSFRKGLNPCGILGEDFSLSYVKLVKVADKPGKYRVFNLKDSGEPLTGEISSEEAYSFVRDRLDDFLN